MRPLIRITLGFTFALHLQAQTSSAGHPMTATDIEAFLDGVMPLQLRREDIAGAVIAVVKDGKLLFAKGYGYSDVAKKTPVSPDATLFRPGSISKLFTWTSVMQLVEQGKLDLDKDVNAYLDFKIPATYPKPITLRNIMTHTPGFEETIKELFLPDAADLRPLGQYLKEWLPQRVYPPGTTPAYSNYATALAGYIVERVSGQSYIDYVEAHVLQPLGMTHTTFRQPLPEPLKPFMSNGYRLASSPPKPFEIVQAWPAGSASVTAVDMTRFMIAHLQDGRFESAQILKPETAKLMHARQFENHPKLNAMALGFYEETRNGHRIVGHGGDTVCFHSDLHLMLDDGVGFFVSYNSAGKGQISPRSALWEAYLDRYYPYTPPSAAPVTSARDDARTVSGNYLVSRRAVTTVFAVTTVPGELKVSTNPDVTISANQFRDLNGQPRHFQEIEPLVFRDVNGQSLVAFKRDDSGGLVLAMDFPFMVFRKAHWYESNTFNMALVVGVLSVLALTVVLWPVAAIVRWHYGRKLELSPAPRRLRNLVHSICAIDLAFAVICLVSLNGLSDPVKLNHRIDPWIHVLQVVGWLGVAGSIVALYNAAKSWVNPKNWWWSKIQYSAVAVACLGFAWFVLHWHMLHWHLIY